MCAYGTVQKFLFHGSYCELTLSLARAFPLAHLPARRNQSPDAVRSRNPFKSTLVQDAVAAAVLHKHHAIIHVGAGLIPFVYRLPSLFATEFNRHRNAFSPFFARVNLKSI